jgi:hypothetical protein
MLLLAMLLLASCKPKPIARQTPPATPTPQSAPRAAAPAATQPATKAIPINPARVARANELAAILLADDSTMTQKVEACYTLEFMGPDAVSAAPALALALGEHDPVQFHASRALLAIGPTAIPALQAAMENGPSTFRYFAADVWAQIDVENGVTAETLNDRLAHGSPIARVEAAVALQGVRQRDLMRAILAHNARKQDGPALDPQKIAMTDDVPGRTAQLAKVALTGKPSAQIAALQYLAGWGEQAGDTAPRIAPLLESKTPSVADAAAKALREMGRAGTIELLAGLKSKNGDTQLLAARSLADSSGLSDALQRREVVMALASAMINASPDVQKTAAESLCTFGPGAVAPLTAAMKAGNAPARAAVLEQIIDDPRSFSSYPAHEPGLADMEFGRQIAPDLLKQMSGANDLQQQRSVIALSYLPADSANPELLKAMQITFRHRMAPMSIDETNALLYRMGPAGLPALLESLNGEDQVLQLRAIGALASRSETSRNPKAIAAMADAMKGSSSPGVRSAAFAWIRKLPAFPREALPHLADLVRDYMDFSLDERVAAGQILAKERYDPAASVKALGAVLRGGESEMQVAAAVALRAFGSDAEPAMKDLVKVASAGHEPAAHAAAETLLGLGQPGRLAAAEYFTDRLAHASDRTSLHSAIEAVADLGPDAPAAVPLLQPWLADHDNGLRMEVADALGKIGPDAAGAIPALSRMADNADIDVRKSATGALVKISPDGKGLVPALMAAVYNGDKGCVGRLAAAVQHADNAQAIRARLDDLAGNDPEEPVRAAARLAMQSLNAGDARPVSATQPKG